MVKFLQKKNIFKNIMQKKKYSDHNFTCASIVKKKTKKQNKNKKKKEKKNKRLCLSGVQLISLRMMFNY